jgi:hypothetical protein
MPWSPLLFLVVLEFGLRVLYFLGRWLYHLGHTIRPSFFFKASLFSVNSLKYLLFKITTFYRSKYHHNFIINVTVNEVDL